MYMDVAFVFGVGLSRSEDAETRPIAASAMATRVRGL